MDNLGSKNWYRQRCPVCGNNSVEAHFHADVPHYEGCSLIRILCRSCRTSLALAVPRDTPADDALQIILEQFKRKMEREDS